MILKNHTHCALAHSHYDELSIDSFHINDYRSREGAPAKLPVNSFPHGDYLHTLS